jgi:hypothetical protein
MVLPCTLWFNSTSQAERNRIFTDVLYPIFVRMSRYHFANTKHPDYVERDVVVTDVVSSLYEAMTNFIPSKTKNPWYYFNLIARNETWRAVNNACKGSDLRHQPITYDHISGDKQKSDFESWGLTDPAPMLDDRPDVDASPLFQACFEFDPELSATLIDLDESAFTAKGLSYTIRAVLSGSITNVDRRLKALRHQFEPTWSAHDRTPATPETREAHRRLLSKRKKAAK